MFFINKVLRRVYSFLLNHFNEKIRKELLLEATIQVTRRFFLEYKDAESMRRVVESHRYRKSIRPILLDVPEASNILIYAPHQDDETVGAGGTLLRCAIHGKRLKVIYVTDGAAATKPTNQNDLSVIRREEAKRVWDFIGGVLPEFWDLPCRKIPLTQENAQIMREQIEESSAECIFIPFFLEAPLDHRRVNQLLLMAHRVRPLPESIQIWSYQVTSILSPNVMVDITELIDKNDIINDMWNSQNVSFNYSHFARGKAAYNSIYLNRERTARPRRRYAEIFFVSGVKEYISILENYVDSLNTTGS